MGSLRLAGLYWLAATLSAQVAIGPDEIRARSGPWVPPPPPNTIKTEVNLVEVPVVVRDGKRRAIGGLKQSDFQVFDNGKKQEITSFSVELLAKTGTTAPAPPAPVSAAPSASPPAAEPQRLRFIIMVLDNMSTPFADLRAIKTAGEKFVRTELAPGDRVAVIATATGNQLTFTHDVDKLVEGIEKVNPMSRFSEVSQGCPRMTAYQAYLIANHMDPETLEGVVQEDMACKHLTHDRAVGDVTGMAHAMWEQAMSNSSNILYTLDGLVDTLHKMPGQRMLLLASAGFLSGNLEYRLEEVTTKARRAEVVINSLDAKGLYAMVPGRPIDAPASPSRSPRTQIAELNIQSRQMSAHDDGMAALALNTGGTFYNNSNDLDKGFRELGAVPDVLYVLGFSPAEANPDGRYHPLKVKLTEGHYALQARLGYTAVPKPPPAQVRAPSPLDLAVMGSDTRSDVPVSFRLAPAESETAERTRTIVIHVDVTKLNFEPRTDRRAVKLAFRCTLTGNGGAFVAGRQGEIELALTQEHYDTVSRDGLNITMPLHTAAPGSYTFRAAVQEPLEGKMTAVSLPMEVK